MCKIENERRESMSNETYTLKTNDVRAVQPQEHEHAQLIESIYSFLNAELLELFVGMLVNSDRSLEYLLKAIETEKNLSDEFEPDEKQELEIKALQLMHREQAQINTNFFIAINEILLPSFQSSFEDHEEEGVSLVDIEEVEEMVAITTMQANALNLFGEEVNYLEARIEYLEIMSAPIFGYQALSPNRICEAFQTAIKPLGITTEIKLILFKYFDEHVNLRLENMYITINNMLIQAGILPEVILSSKQDEAPVEKSENGIVTQTVNYYDPQENKSTDFIPRSQSEMNSIVGQFMSGDISVMGDELELPASFYKDPNEPSANGKDFFARKDVIECLDVLQSKLLKLGTQSDLVNHNEIKESLMKEMGVDEKDPVAKEMAVLDERSIDFVGMMFDAITNDESISPVISDLLMQLQIPILKIAVTDEELFTNDEHPARNVLNLIPKAGKGVTDEQDRLYLELYNIVNTILNEYEMDTICFDNAVDTLRDLIENQECLAKEKEKEEQKAIINEHAKSVVISEIRSLIALKAIPKSVQPLVLKNWATLMLNRYIKNGKESYQWLESVLMLKLLMKTLQPIEQNSQWEFLNNNHSALIESVNDELYETKQSRAIIDSQVPALKTTFLKMLEEFDYKVEEAALESEPEEIVGSIEIDMAKELDMARQEAVITMEKINRLPEEAKPGVWFEVFNGEDKAIRRLKMSTILTEAAKVIFVDRKGVKIIEKDAGDFADELKTNKSRLLADHSTFDHALGKVIGAMAA